MSPPAQERAEAQLSALCELYNAALQERRDAWKKAGLRVTFYDQSRQLPEIKRMRTEYASIDAQVLEGALRRLDRAFDGFFRRAKAGQKPGYPRFKSWRRYDSMTFRQTGWKLNGRRLTLRGIGTAKLFLSRPVEGRVKTVTLKRDACGDWWVTLSCDDVPARPLPDTGAEVGVDLGLSSFIATSDDETAENPRHLRAAEAGLQRAQRTVSKRKRGGSRRRRAVRTLARRHRRVRDARRDFHFKTALDLVRRYDVIAVEDLNVRGLARSKLAKSVNDAGWADFLHALRTKAEEAGRTVVEVDPRGTSQECSGCGHVPEKRKTLAVRIHRCERCGIVLDRDVNAARNILTRGRAALAASRPATEAAA